MAADNVGWGAPRIHGELLKLGFEVSQSTVSRSMPRTTKPPSQTWRAFLANHMHCAAAIDFFVVPTVTFGLLYVFVVLEHARRRIAHINVTDEPGARWTAQQVINAFPFDSAPRFLHRDRDAICSSAFGARVGSMGIEQVVSAPRSPWQNPYVERLIGSIRRECTDHLIVTGETHLRRILGLYVSHYNEDRTHLSLGKDSPTVRPAQSRGSGVVVALPRVGGPVADGRGHTTCAKRSRILMDSDAHAASRARCPMPSACALKEGRLSRSKVGQADHEHRRAHPRSTCPGGGK